MNCSEEHGGSLGGSTVRSREQSREQNPNLWLEFFEEIAWVSWEVPNSRTNREQNPQIPSKTVLYDAARGQKNKLLSDLVGNNGLEVRVLPGSPSFSSEVFHFHLITRRREIRLDETRSEIISPSAEHCPRVFPRLSLEFSPPCRFSVEVYCGFGLGTAPRFCRWIFPVGEIETGGR